MISVIVCTRNRRTSFERCLDALAEQVASDFEVVVVDNASTDDTAEFLAGEMRRERLPLRWVTENNAGLSYARNRGVAEAQGEILVFLDDDAFVEPDWLRGYQDAFASTEADIIQGRIFCEFASSRPSWLGDVLLPRLTFLDLGDRPSSYDNPLVGANFGVRRKVFDACGLFSTNLGAGASGFGEDTEFGARARSKGFSAIYCPTASVRHLAHSDRLTRRGFLRRCYLSGRSQTMFNDGNESRFRAACHILRIGVITALSICITWGAEERMVKASDFAERLGRAIQIIKGERNA